MLNSKNIIYGIFFYISALALFFIYSDYLEYMFSLWVNFSKEGNKFFYFFHGFLFAPIAIVMMHLNLFRHHFSSSKNSIGILFIIIGLLLGVFGEFSAIYYAANIGFLLALIGLIVAYWGLGFAYTNWKLMLLLLILIPLPQFILIQVYSHLGSLLTKLSIFVAQGVGLSVFLDGNIVDFGESQYSMLAIVEPLAYLFLFIASSILLLSFSRPGMVLFLLTLASGPIVLFTFIVLRIIGIVWISNTGGTESVSLFSEMTSGVNFLAAGIVFQGCMFLIVQIIFSREFNKQIHNKMQSVKFSAFVSNFPEMRSSFSAVVSTLLIIFSTIFISFYSIPKDREPNRLSFDYFPRVIGAYTAKEIPADPVQLESLQLSDWLSLEYASLTASGKLNVWIAYYSNQKPGASIHSPKACLTGGGWEMIDGQVFNLTGLAVDGKNIAVNRAIMQQGHLRQLTYFWYNLGGSIVTNEYLVKWYIFWNKLARQRTDGALIRLITRIDDDEPIEAADARLKTFMQVFLPALSPYLPNRYD